MRIARRLSTRGLNWSLALICLAMFVALVPMRAPMLEAWGDEGTFLSMSESLARDFDLRFDERDRERLEGAPPGRSTVILQRTPDGGIAFSKPIFYALVSAPFSALFGDVGPVLLNALAFFFALLLTLAYLRRLEGGDRALLVLVTFVGASVLLPYIWWRMSDLFQTSLALAGFVLCLGRWRGTAPEPNRLQRLIDWRHADLLGMVLLGLLTSMRVSNGALAAVPVLGLLFVRRFKRATLLAVVALLAYFAMAGVTAGLTGTSSPYRAVRTSFTTETGYPVGTEAAQSADRFQEQMATVWTGIRPNTDFYRVAYAGLYFLIGRHSGFLFYFPAGLIFIFAALRWGDRYTLAMLLGFAASVAFYLGWLPWNYFGGDTFLGNRYLLAAYPALLLASRRLPNQRALTFAWLLTCVVLGSALFSASSVQERDRTSQNHAYGGIFRLLPYESTAQALAGRRDRYWAGHFVRFVDPFAEVKAGHFEIQAKDPATEILVAHWQEDDELRLLVSASTPDATLTVSDYRQQETFALGPADTETRIEFSMSPSWRKHLFWWDQQTLYQVHTVRLQMNAKDESATAQVRYLGQPEIWESAFAYETIAIEIPESGNAGGRSPGRLVVRNTSLQTWKPQDVLPVYAKYRLFGPGDPTLLAAESRPIRLPDAVQPQQEVELLFDIDWPLESGEYRLEVDLILSRLAWFQDRLGHPIVRQEVRVSPPLDEPSQE